MPPKQPSKRSKRSHKSQTATQESATSFANLPPELKYQIFLMVTPKSSKRIASIFLEKKYDHLQNNTKSGYTIRPAPSLFGDGSHGIARSVLGIQNAAQAHQRNTHTMNTIQRIIRNNLSPLFTTIRQKKGKGGRINLYANNKLIPPCYQWDPQQWRWIPAQGPAVRRPFNNCSDPSNYRFAPQQISKAIYQQLRLNPPKIV